MQFSSLRLPAWVGYVSALGVSVNFGDRFSIARAGTVSGTATLVTAGIGPHTANAGAGYAPANFLLPRTVSSSASFSGSFTPLNSTGSFLFIPGG